jgi:hypothetical protein
MKHCDCSPFARPASFAQLAMAAYTPLLAVETIPSPFCSRADILPLTMDRFAPEPDIPSRSVFDPHRKSALRPNAARNALMLRLK